MSPAAIREEVIPRVCARRIGRGVKLDILLAMIVVFLFGGVLVIWRAEGLMLTICCSTFAKLDC